MLIKYQPKETFGVYMTNLTEQKGPRIISKKKKRNAMKCSGKEQQTLIFLKLARSRVVRTSRVVHERN